MSSKILVLDDSNERQKIFKQNLIGNASCHAYTYQQAINFLDDVSFNLIYLDHDLNLEDNRSLDEDGRELTGADVARHIASMDKEKYPSLVIVHSFNPIGAENIMRILKGVNIRCRRELFSKDIGK